MPANKPVSKQYAVVAEAGIDNVRASPQTPDRAFLYIQNTGSNPGVLRIADDVRGDGGDIVIVAGASLQWDNPNTTPREALNFASQLGTSFAVIEGLLR